MTEKYVPITNLACSLVQQGVAGWDLISDRQQLAKSGKEAGFGTSR